MKIVLSLTIFWLNILNVHSVRGQDTNKTTLTINYVNVPVNEVLDNYQRMVHRQLHVASNVELRNQLITFHFVGEADAALPLLEQALLKQAGIVITSLDDKHSTVSITNSTRDVTYMPFKHNAASGAAFASYAMLGRDAEIIQMQLLNITNGSGQRICAHLDEADATTINLYFFKTNGVPYRAHLTIK